MAEKNHDIQVFFMPGENTFHFNQTNVCLRLKYYESMIIVDLHSMIFVRLNLLEILLYFKQYIPKIQSM